MVYTVDELLIELESDLLKAMNDLKDSMSNERSEHRINAERSRVNRLTSARYLILQYNRDRNERINRDTIARA